MVNMLSLLRVERAVYVGTPTCLKRVFGLAYVDLPVRLVRYSVYRYHDIYLYTKSMGVYSFGMKKPCPNAPFLVDILRNLLQSTAL